MSFDLSEHTSEHVYETKEFNLVKKLLHQFDKIDTSSGNHFFLQKHGLPFRQTISFLPSKDLLL
jgi:hypothetical protein